MITEWVIGVLVGAVHGLLGTLPVMTPPAWLTGAAGNASTVMGTVNGMGTWMPWPILLTVSAACLTTWLVGFGIKVVRIIASFVTLGGGSAA